MQAKPRKLTGTYSHQLLVAPLGAGMAPAPPCEEALDSSSDWPGGVAAPQPQHSGVQPRSSADMLLQESLQLQLRPLPWQATARYSCGTNWHHAGSVEFWPPTRSEGEGV